MTSRTTRSVTVIAGLAAVAITMAGCGGGQGQSAPPPNGKIDVVASTNVWGSVVEAVGGDAVQVRSIIKDPSADPHSYQAEPADATAMAGAKLAISNGGGYDDFFTKLADESGKGAKRIVAVDVSGKDVGHDEAHGSGEAHQGETHQDEPHQDEPHQGEPHQEEAHQGNEHVWYDLPTVRKVADTVATELGAIAPDKKDTFANNAKAFNARIDELVTRTQEIGKANPGAKVVVTEPIAAYLLETAGVADVTPPEFSKAIEEENDPPAAAVAETTRLVADRQVAALVNNAQTETPVTKQLNQSAAAAGVPVVNVTETLPEGVTGYVDWMNRQVDALSGALKK